MRAFPKPMGPVVEWDTFPVRMWRKKGRAARADERDEKLRDR